MCFSASAMAAAGVVGQEFALSANVEHAVVGHLLSAGEFGRPEGFQAAVVPVEAEGREAFAGGEVPGEGAGIAFTLRSLDERRQGLGA